MGKRTEYKKGDVLGPYNVVFLKEVDPYVPARGSNIRKGLFLCSFCKTNTFEAPITRVKTGKQWRCKNCYHIKDLTNQKFGYLTALKPLNKRTNAGGVIWLCKCCCGNYIEVASGNLVYGTTKSCGCIIRQKNNLIGQKFNRLTVIDFSHSDKKHNYWKCQCDCGNKIITTTDRLTGGNTQSCGCLKSKGESLIQKILEEKHITFKKEKTFKDCLNPKTKNNLKFDFYLPDYNCCIEYDGEQHFCEPRGAWAYYSIQERQELDNIKTNYCKDNNIKLIRIPYWEYNNINWNFLSQKIKGEK